MSDRPASPVFVGRAEQLAALDDALERAAGGSSATVLVGGEAGIGKSRLAAEFAAAAAVRKPEAVRTLFGGCLELGVDGLPFAPFTAALRQVVRELGTAEVTGILPGGPRELARLLPELGDPPAETEGSRLRLFEHVRLLLDGLADSRPLALVIEDAHWADRSTRDLLTFLVHNLDPARVVLVVTYRSDELHRTHPLRPLLAELDRIAQVTRIELARLSRREVGDQLAGIIGRAPEPGLIHEAYERSNGNPLFVESLVSSDGQLRAGLSDSLRELLLVGVRRLPEETQRVLRTAAAAGNRVDHSLLVAITGIEGLALDELLRAAVDGRVMLPDEHGYAFRHALIREALESDLLPGERTGLHRRYAEALERQPTDDCTAERAHHWYAAHDAPRALAAAWCAAAGAKSALAYAEQLSMLERVLELWDQVPDAVDRVGMDNRGVLELAISAAWAIGEVDRGVAYADALLRELDTDDGPEGQGGGQHAERSPVRVARALELRGRMLRGQGREAGMEDLRRAATLVPADPPSADRASVLATLAHALLLEPSVEEARSLSAEALAVAREIGDEVTEANVLSTLACACADGGGDVDETLALLGEARSIARRVGEPMIAVRVDIAEADAYEGAGLHHQAVEVGRRGLADAYAYGLARGSGPLLACNLAESLGSLGRWDEGIEVTQTALELRPTPAHQAMLRTWEGFIAVARGDYAVAEDAVRTVATIFSTCYVSAQDQLPPARLEAELRLAQGRTIEALAVIERALSTYSIEVAHSSRYAWPLLAVGAEVCAACAAEHSPDHDSARRAAEVLTELRRVAAGLPVYGPIQRARRATFLAAAEDAARSDDDSSGGDWRAAVRAWEDIDPYPLAAALHRAGAAAIASGDRDDAADLLRRSAEIADRLGAVPLRRAVDDLARRARITLGEASATPADDTEPLGLTPREVEVLRLIAAGHSNRRIAEELFISVKTASVHVSNILAKLGVSSRGEAAAVAHSRGLSLSS